MMKRAAMLSPAKPHLQLAGMSRFFRWTIMVWLLSQVFFLERLSPKWLFGVFGDRGPVRLLFFFILCMFVFQILKRRFRLLPLDKLDGAILLLLGLSLMSLWRQTGDSSYETGRWLTTLSNMFLFPFAIYFVVRRTRYERQTAKYLLVFVCILGGYLALEGNLEHFKVNSLVWPSYILDSGFGIHYGRTRGPFGSAQTMGKMLIVGFGAMMLLVSEREAQRKKLLYLFMILSAGAIYFTYTRAIWLGFAIVLSLAAILQTSMRRPARIMALLALVAALSGAAGKFSLIGGEETLFSRRQSTVDGRLAGWVTASRMIRSNPVFGVGFGRYNDEWDHYYSYKKVEDLHWSGKFDGNHNTHLGIAAEIGLTGYFFFAAIMALILKMCFDCYRRLDARIDHFELKLTAFAAGLLLMHLFTGLFNDIRFNPITNTTIFLFAGIIHSLYETVVLKRPAEELLPIADPAPRMPPRPSLAASGNLKSRH